MPLEAVCNCIVFSEFCSVENSFMKWSALQENQKKKKKKKEKKEKEKKGKKRKERKKFHGK